MDTDLNHHNENDAPAGDLLIGATVIEAYLKILGVPRAEVNAMFDAHLKPAVGRFAYGFNLDGKGAKQH